ncbi:hypothetical protein ACH5RR_039378, partial [Cinchona calisaya]
SKEKKLSLNKEEVTSTPSTKEPLAEEKTKKDCMVATGAHSPWSCDDNLNEQPHS